MFSFSGVFVFAGGFNHLYSGAARSHSSYQETVGLCVGGLTCVAHMLNFLLQLLTF